MKTESWPSRLASILHTQQVRYYSYLMAENVKRRKEKENRKLEKGLCWKESNLQLKFEGTKPPSDTETEATYRFHAVGWMLCVPRIEYTVREIPTYI